MLKSIKNQLKKAKKEAAALPRPMAEIQKEYSELCNRAGQAQYQLYVFEQEVKAINQALVSVNNEAAARQKLDQQEAQEKAKEQPVTQTEGA